MKRVTRSVVIGIVVAVVYLLFFAYLLFLAPSCVGGSPQLIVNDYSTRVEPLRVEQEEPIRVRSDRPRVYGPGPFEDPTAVVFKNLSDVVTYEVFVDDDPDSIELLPGHVSQTMFLPVGKHKVVVKGRRATWVFGEIELPEQLIAITVRPRGQAKIIMLQ